MRGGVVEKHWNSLYMEATSDRNTALALKNKTKHDRKNINLSSKEATANKMYLSCFVHNLWLNSLLCTLIFLIEHSKVNLHRGRLCKNYDFQYSVSFFFIYLSVAPYPESVFRFNDVAVENRGFHIMRNVEDLRDLFWSWWRNGCPHLFNEVLSMDSSLSPCKETVLSVYAVLWLDLTGWIILGNQQNL